MARRQKKRKPKNKRGSKNPSAQSARAPIFTTYGQVETEGGRSGFFRPQLQMFQKALLPSLAKEPPQNSTDARSDDAPGCVSLEYNEYKVRLNEIPNIKEITDIYKEAAKQAPDTATQEFCDSAVKALAEDEITILTIADTGTTGCNEDTFNAFWKGLAHSVKPNEEGEASGGSRGVGKNCFIANSSLQLAFFASTDEETNEFRAGGINIVQTIDWKGKSFGGVFYTGIGKSPVAPITNTKGLPTWLAARHNQPGTTAYIIGFNVKNWEDSLAFHIGITNFPGIYKGEVEFKIGNHNLNASSILKELESERYGNLAKNDESDQKALALARINCECLVSNESITETLKYKEYKLKVTLLKGVGQQTVSLIRGGRFITSENPLGSKRKFTRFTGHDKFVCIIEPIGKPLSTIIKNLENYSHTELSTDNIKSALERSKIENTVNKLANLLIEFINEHTKQEAIHGLEENLLTEYIKAIDSGDSDKDEINYNPAKPVFGKTGKISEHQKRVNKGIKKRKRNIVKPVRKKLNRKRKLRSPLQIIDPRVTLTANNKNDERIIFFTVQETKNVRVALVNPGLNSADSTDLEITDSDRGKVKDGKVELRCKKQTRVKLEVKLNKPHSLGGLETRIQTI